MAIRSGVVVESEMNDTREDEIIQYREEEASAFRKLIARRMIQSKLTAPHFYLSVDVDVKRLMKIRDKANAQNENKISYNDIIMKAIAQILAVHPECNVSYENDKIRYYNEANIGIAVAVPGGLLTPVVRNCEKKNITEISDEVNTLIAMARNKKLRPRNSQGGTFTLTNLGMYGIEEFAAIINPPQSLILAIGAIRETPVVIKKKIEVGKRMKMTLSCDHRVIDGATGAIFLSELKTLLEMLPQDSFSFVSPSMNVT